MTCDALAADDGADRKVQSEDVEYKHHDGSFAEPIDAHKGRDHRHHARFEGTDWNAFFGSRATVRVPQAQSSACSLYSVTNGTITGNSET